MTKDEDERTRQDRAAEPERGDDIYPPGHETLPIVARRAPGRKNTRDWCKGKRGRPHTPVITVPANTWDHRACTWKNLEYVHSDWEPRVYYSCNHAEVCAECGKVLRRAHGWIRDSPLTARECPDYREPGT